MKKSSPQGVREPGVKVTTRPKKTRTHKPTTKQHVHKSMTVSDILVCYPQATEIMAEYGLHCFGCSANSLESLEDGCLGHGFSAEDVANLVSDINELIDNMLPRPQTLIITESAAMQIQRIAKSEGKDNEGLTVMADEHGGFFMEFRPEPDRGDKTFNNPKVPDVRIFASLLTLQRIGGAMIDYHDDRFKLDVEEAKACACGEECGCKS